MSRISLGGFKKSKMLIEIADVAQAILASLPKAGESCGDPVGSKKYWILGEAIGDVGDWLETFAGGLNFLGFGGSFPFCCTLKRNVT